MTDKERHTRHEETNIRLENPEGQMKRLAILAMFCSVTMLSMAGAGELKAIPSVPMQPTEHGAELLNKGTPDSQARNVPGIVKQIHAREQKLEVSRPLSRLVYPPKPDPERFLANRSLFLGPEKPSDRDRPSSLVVGSGKIYVSYPQRGVIRSIDFEMGTYFESEEGLLSEPNGLALGPTGRLYVANSGQDEIVVLDASDLSIVGRVALHGPKRPTGVAFNKQSQSMVVLAKNHVYEVNMSDGRTIRSFGQPGDGAGDFKSPVAVAINGAGHVIVVDEGNYRLQVFETSAASSRVIGKKGRTIGSFMMPKSVALDKDDNIYVVDGAFANFQIFAPSGQLLMFVGTRDEKREPGNLMAPIGISLDERGRVFVLDIWQNKIESFDRLFP